MLFTKGLIKLLSINLRYLNIFSTYFYQIDPTSFKLSFRNTKSVNRKLIARCVVLLITLIVMKCQLVFYRNSFPSVTVYESLLYIAAIQGMLAMSYVHYTKGAQIVELYNMLIEFERRLINGNICVKINK